MSKTLTKPTKSTYRLTPEQARANQAKAVQSRITRSSLAKAHASGASQAVDYVEFTITFTARTQMMLFRLCFMFDHAKRTNDLDGLTRSMERLFGIWAHLTQTPAPGQLRPEKMKKLLREYGMKSAIANAMAQPDPTTPVQSPDLCNSNGNSTDNPQSSQPKSGEQCQSFQDTKPPTSEDLETSQPVDSLPEPHPTPDISTSDSPKKERPEPCSPTE